jgi:hypothetical protein
VGGLVLGGGYGYLARMLGFSVDNLLEAEVVLHNGDVVVANDGNAHSDLIWGLRGGSGNFGIGMVFFCFVILFVFDLFGCSFCYCFVRFAIVLFALFALLLFCSFVTVFFGLFSSNGFNLFIVTKFTFKVHKLPPNCLSGITAFLTPTLSSAVSVAENFDAMISVCDREHQCKV